MRYLKTNTAVIVTVGPFYDKTDGVTIETGLTITNERITLTADTDDNSAPTNVLDNVTGATSGTANDLNYITGNDAGMMQLELSAANTNRLGRMYLSITDAANHVPVFHEFTVLPANIYDSMILGTDLFDVSTTQFNGSAVTASSGRPEVNLTHISGSANSTTTAQLGVNVVQISTDATAADNLEAAYDGAGYAGGTIPQQVILTTSGNNAVADQVWDEALSGHVAAGSAGAAQYIIASGTATAGAGTTITLAVGSNANNDFYNNQRIHIVSGLGVGQGRIISDYDGGTRVATVSTWITQPDNTSVYVILPFGSIPGASAPTAAEVADAVWDEAMSGHLTAGSTGQILSANSIRAGTAQAGSAASITLDASASSTDDIYNFQVVQILSGTGAGQARQITDYVQSTKVATVAPNWTTNPSSDSVFLIRPLGIDAATVATIADAVWDEARAGHVAAGSFGEYTNADVLRFSGDATAADNAEAFFDGTGYAGTNNVIPSVTTVTGNVNGNVAGSVASVTGNVGGNVTGSVGTVNALAANVITAAATAADFTTEVTASLATSSALTTVGNNVTSIKSKTDSLTFTVANQVDANIQSVNDAEVTGNGDETPWDGI